MAMWPVILISVILTFLFSFIMNNNILKPFALFFLLIPFLYWIYVKILNLKIIKKIDRVLQSNE